MPKAHITELWRYPLKGFAGEQLRNCFVGEGKGIQHDRRWGVVDGKDREEVEAEAYPSYKLFYVLKSNACTAKIGFAVDDADKALVLREGSEQPIKWGLSDPSLCAGVAAEISARLGWGKVEVVDHAYSPLWDYSGGLLSVVNVKSIASLSAKAGVELDSRRFRANIFVDGLDPWEEQNWIGRDISLGANLRLRVVREIPRCRATCVNPDTAEVDVQVPKLLRQHFGHANLGVLGVPVQSGDVSAGDEAR